MGDREADFGTEGAATKYRSELLKMPEPQISAKPQRPKKVTELSASVLHGEIPAVANVCDIEGQVCSPQDREKRRRLAVCFTSGLEIGNEPIADPWP